MTEEQKFEKRKEKLIDSYMEYITKLKSLSLADVSNANKYKEVVFAHATAASAAFGFTEYINNYLQNKRTL